jgi:glycosyltransferase involved in cell wall biosynthesis
MKLVYTNSHPSDLLTDERAGHLVRARALIGGLTELGHEVLIVEAASGAGSQAAVSAYRGKLSRLPRRLQLIIRDLGRLVQSLVHGWRVGRIARSNDVRAIVETHNTGSVAGWLAAKLSGRPLILDDVTPAGEDDQFYELGLPGLARWIRRGVLRSAAGVVTVSTSIQRALIAEGVEPGRIGIVPNGSLPVGDLGDRESWRNKLQVGDGDRAIAYVGSFQPFHNVPVLIRAMAHPLVPSNAIAVLVGDGETRAECEALASELGVEQRVRFAGRIDHEHISGVLAAADAAVLPGTADYMNPMKLYEYASARLPSAAPDQPSVHETLTDPTGFVLFQPDDVASCAAALAAIVAADAPRPVASLGVGWLDRSTSLASLIESSRPRKRR